MSLTLKEFHYKFGFDANLFTAVTAKLSTVAKTTAQTKGCP